MAIELQICNFRKLESVELCDPGKVSVVLGYNEAGKSSLAGAVEFAATGSAYGLKGKDVAELVRHGQTRLKVEMRCGDISLSRTQTSGLAIKDVAAKFGLDAAALPLILNPRFCAQSGGKAMAAFLALRESDPIDVAALFSKQPGLKDLLAEVFSAAKSDSPKDIQAAAEALRAQNQTPSAPQKPFGDKGAAEAKIAELEGCSAAYDELEAANAKVLVCSRLIAFYKALAAYEEFAAQNTSDSLGDRRPALRECSLLDASFLTKAVDVLTRAGFDAAAKSLGKAEKTMIAQIEAAKEILEKHPMPIDQKRKLPVLGEETGGFRDSLPNCTQEVAEAKLVSLEEERDSLLAKLPAEYPTRDLARDSISAQMRTVAALDAYETAIGSYDSRVSGVKARWDAFDSIAKAVAGARETRRTTAATNFLESVSTYAAPILGGRKLTLSADDEMCLGDLPLDLLSDSTRWRLLTAIMAAIAKAAGSPLLILDGFDILDAKNRRELMSFIMKQLSSDFEHILVISTLRGQEEDEEPLDADGFTKWLLTDGHLRAIV